MYEMVADRMRGCVLGGAIGDALGAGIEFLSLAEIRDRFGPLGVTGYTPAYGRACAITDDTQMTLFTLEGLLRTSIRFRTRGVASAPMVVRHAYLRWLSTQTPNALQDRSVLDGWLIGVKGLHAQRAPGMTCLSALRVAQHEVTDRADNDSKGCGGVMRAAPAGFPRLPIEQRFELGCDIAALTHGHPDGQLPAGYLAVAVGELVDGRSLPDALGVAEQALRRVAPSSGTAAAVAAGLDLGRYGLPTGEQLESLGGGWVGDEALAISLACVVAGAPFRETLLASVNHSGDSDSTGSIAGNLMGAAAGARALPPEWLSPLELREVMIELVDDAAREFRGDPPTDDYGGATEEWYARYPGW